MTFTTKAFLTDRVVQLSHGIGIVFVVASVIWIFFRISPTSDPVALHYSIYVTIDRIGDWPEIFLPATVIWFLLLWNYFVCFLIHERSQTLAWVIACASSCLGVISLIYAVVISTVKFVV